MKRLKYILKVITVMIGILILGILISFINNKIHLSKEKKLFQPLGQMVEVNGHKMNVYVEGSGEETLVFMSGGGTSSPVLDFKSLYSLLSDKYRIIVVEKAGYGFSDITSSKRDIDTILSETRESISKVGIKGPYILCPHSMSGIEALYWAQKYPKEIKAIIGLDMSVPASYNEYEVNIPIIELGSFANNIGLTRLISSLSESDAIKYGTLSEDEKKLYKIIFYRRTATKNMINEVKEIKSNAKEVAENGIPNIPILIFSSNGVGTGWDKNKWRSFQNDYIKNLKNGKLIELDCTHYVHDIEYTKIAKEIDKFIL